MPDGSDACLEGKFEGRIEAQLAEQALAIKDIRADVKTILEDYLRRRARDQLIRDVSAAIAGAFSIIGVVVGLFKTGQTAGWWR